MALSELTDNDLLRQIIRFERQLTEMGLSKHKVYQAFLREAIRRGLKTENLTEEQIAARIEAEGPGFDRVI